ncbi:3-dehydrosphinganine reductase [Sporothrix eucalyptigena]|uniref:3-dehydrosphinganine reductase n=1 Tax=Sporothrix eucalyptigena TaxID=1812306 RepID=A0ABP0AJM8_9PEZI
MGFFSGNQMPVDGKTVLITGASEGMGRSAARLLAAQGASVIVVARNVERLTETVAEIKAAAKSSTQRFHYVSADVAVPNYAEAVIKDALAWNGDKPIDIVWCVAGMSTPMLWAEETNDVAIGASRRNMDVNYWGAAEMAHAILREWLRPEAGPYKEPRHLIFTASVLALYPVAGYATYTPTKWALRGLADTLTQEVMLYEKTNPVRVSMVFPGTILSPGFERETKTKPDVTIHLEKDDPQFTPDEVASKAIKGLQRGDHFVTVSMLGDVMRWGVLGGAPRNNWILDTLGAYLMAFAMYFVLWWFHGEIKTWGKKNGHPSTYKRKL